MEHGRSFRFGLVFALAMTEVMPVMLLAQALPVLLRQGGASLEEISALYLVMSPWALKCLWAPLVDRFGSRRIGRYRSWLFVLHPLLIAASLGLALVDFPTLLIEERGLALACLAGLTVLSATADTAADGLAITLLRPEERGAGNGYQMAGTMAGNLIGGGLMLILIARIGWTSAMAILGSLIVLPLLGVWRYREPPAPPGEAVTLRAVLAPLREPRLRRWMLLLMLLEASYAVVYTPMQALLTDHGLGMAEVGVALGFVGSLAGGLGGVVGGALVQRAGRRRAFFGAGALTAASVPLLRLGLPAAAPVWSLYALVGLVTFAIMALGTVLYTMMMDRARGATAGSDYTLQYSALQVASFLAMAFGGALAESLGAGLLFGAAPFLVLAVLGMAARLLSPREFTTAPREAAD